jgi:5-formaminoimidazole-4-carboxamide-1-(beta)-D-ribofuranosyl 5'-monophosphate synthetase
MIKASEIKKIVNDYSDVRIGVLGSHSALEVMDGAKEENFQTSVYCQKGREGPYQRFGRIADEIVVLDKFKDMASAKNQKILRDTNTIVVPHRSFNLWKQKTIPSRRANC